jgi:hypothetical protein
MKFNYIQSNIAGLLVLLFMGLILCPDKDYRQFA